MTSHRRALLAVGVAFVLGLTACTSAHPSASRSSEPPLGFRTPPSFLPTSQSPVDTVMTASAGHPQLAAQGVAVEVDLPAGQSLATITGPQVPPFVAPPPENVTATFDISLAHVSGTVPVRLADFTITDQNGRTFVPSYVSGETPPPATAPAGTALDFHVTAVMPTGEGRIYWAPGGGNPIAGWDFIVEND